MCLVLGQFQGFCAMCELHRHITRVMNTSGGVVKPIPIVQNLKGSFYHFKIEQCYNSYSVCQTFSIWKTRRCTRILEIFHRCPPTSLSPWLPTQDGSVF